MPINRATDKKKALLAYKEKILNDIKYYEKRINDDLSNLSKAPISVNFEDRFVCPPFCAINSPYS